MSHLRTKARTQNSVPPAVDDIEERWFDEWCASELKEKESRELVSWLQKGKRCQRELGELTKREAVSLAERLYSSGAVKVWVTGIERDCDGGEYAKRLVILLPDSTEQRGKIFKLCADPARPYLSGVAPAARIGLKYMGVNLM